MLEKTEDLVGYISWHKSNYSRGRMKIVALTKMGYLAGYIEIEKSLYQLRYKDFLLAKADNFDTMHPAAGNS
jgi:hypothetical protein